MPLFRSNRKKEPATTCPFCGEVYSGYKAICGKCKNVIPIRITSEVQERIKAYDEEQKKHQAREKEQQERFQKAKRGTQAALLQVNAAAQQDLSDSWTPRSINAAVKSTDQAQHGAEYASPEESEPELPIWTFNNEEEPISRHCFLKWAKDRKIVLRDPEARQYEVVYFESAREDKYDPALVEVDQYHHTGKFMGTKLIAWRSKYWREKTGAAE